MKDISIQTAKVLLETVDTALEYNNAPTRDLNYLKARITKQIQTAEILESIIPPDVEEFKVSISSDDLYTIAWWVSCIKRDPSKNGLHTKFNDV